MPPELPARSPVTVQQIDDDTWIVKRARPVKTRMVMLLPDVKEMPADPAWEKTEAAFTAAGNRGLAPFEE